MNPPSSLNKKALRTALILLALAALLLPVAGQVAADRPPLYTISQQPPPFPGELPVYRLIPPLVNQDTAQGLAEILGNLNPTEVFSSPTHTGTTRFIVFGEGDGSILEQFEARGGFFAYNPNFAFEETIANLDYGSRTVCHYLLSKKLFPSDVLPAAVNCDGQAELPYMVSPITLATLSLENPENGTDAVADSMVIGEVYQVPLAFEVGRDLGTQPLYIPVGGPGGHLSILLTGYDERPPLDMDLIGLQALAIPTHGVNRERVGIFPVIPPGVAAAALESRLQVAMPEARLALGEPDLIYYLDDPAVDQEFTVPSWYFPDATAVVDGEEVNLRGYTIPAVEGFLPEVTITSPDDGTVYFPGAQIQLAAMVTSGEPPYDFSLELEDGTQVASGTSEDGVITLTTLPLPAGERPDEGIFLNLEVIDDIGAAGMDSLYLQSPLRVFMPTMLRQAGGLEGINFYETFTTPQPQAVDAIRSMGAQWIRYYNGHGSDLPGTQPDGTGFYNKMRDFGWTGKFHYYNNNAWEKDWRDCSLGGIDCTYGVDRVDFAYFAGHGSPAKIYFGTNKDSYSFAAENARYQNLRWAGFATCQTLRAGPYVGPGNPPLTKWFNSFRGSYMLLGFHSNMADVAFGPRLADNLTPVMFFGIPLYQNTIREAWVLTAFQMNAGKPAYLYARSASFNPVNLKLPAASSVDPAPLNPGSIIQYLWVWW